MTTISTLFVGERSLGAATGRQAGKAVELLHVRTLPLPADYAGRDADGRAVALREALERSGLDLRAVVVVVPRAQAILRSFPLPPGSAEEIHRMVGFQLEKDLPLPPDQVRSSYALSPGPDGRVLVGASAVPIEALDRIVAPLAKAGVKATGAVVGSFGLPHLLPAGPSDGTLVVQVADGTAEIAILDGGAVALSRTVPADPVDPEVLATEIGRALLSQQAAGGRREVQRVVVAGDDEEADRLATGLQLALGREVGRAVPDPSVLRPAALRLADAGAVAAGVCLGLLSGRAPLPDVLHPPAPRRALRLGRGARVGILAAVAAIALVAWAQVTLSDLRAEHDRLKAEYDKVKPHAEKVARLRGHLAAVNLWQDARFAWIDVLAGLRSKLDRQKLHLTSLSAGDSGWVVAKGKATDDTHVTGYIAELQKLAPFFREVVADSITTAADSGGGYRHDFSLRIRVDGLGPPPRK